MSKIFKNMIPYWKIVIAIIGLLVVQAWCDLSLPSYTSDIIDVGIQNHGVEHVMPGKIQEEEFQTAQFIMTDQEKRIWNDIYVKKGDTKVLKNLSQDRLEELRTACAATDHELSNECHGGENLRKNGGEPDGIRKQK